MTGDAEAPADARVVKRSLTISGHRTSVSLEEAFWRRFKHLAAERGHSLSGLAAAIDATRGGANLSSAIRVFVLERASAFAAAGADGPPRAQPSRPASQ